MSSFQPYIDTSYPIYPAEEAARPYQPAPVAGVEGTAPARQVESEENSGVDGRSATADALALSNAARELSRNADEEALRTRDISAAAAIEAVSAGENLGIRELIQSFANYNNTAALARYANSLSMFARYGSAYSTSDETDAVANLRAQENSLYQDPGAFYTDNVTMENREGISQAIDRWFVGEGVFMPAMLHFSSSDGFRFTPLTSEAQKAQRAADVFATYDRSRIVAYLREMAELTPEDFMFYDPTELTELRLQERRDFLARMDELLVQAEIDARAAELRYVFNTENQLDQTLLGLEAEEIARLELYREDINTYYGMLRESVRQYDDSIVSASFA